MPVYEYTARVNLDGPGFEKQYQKYNAKMEKLANGNWKIHLSPDEKDIMRMVQEINKTHPEMIVQLKYVINETEIQAEQKKLESMKTVLDVSPKANVAAFSKIIDEVERLYEKLDDENLSKDSSKGLYDNIRSKLKSAAEIYTQMKANDDSYRVFVGGVGEKLDSYRLFIQDFNLGSYAPAPVDSSAIDAQIEKIEELKQRRDELIKQGAEPLPEGSAGKASQEADQLAGHLDKASQKADQLNEKLEGKGHKVTIFDGIKEETYDTIKDLDRLKEKLTEIAKSGKVQWNVGNLTNEVLNGGNFGKADTLRKWIEAELPSAGTADVYLQPWLSQLFETSALDVSAWEGAASEYSGVKNKRLYAIDTSKYNMLEIASDQFEADYREGFGADLSAYILSRIKEIVDPSLLSQQIKESINSLTSEIEYDDPEKFENELFEKYKDILTKLGVNFETYKSFLRREIGNAENFPSELEALNSEHYKTRFERYAIPGIQGIDIGKTLLVNDTTIGSTIFDVDKKHPFTIDFGAIEDAANEDVRSMLLFFQDQLISQRVTDIIRQNPEWAGLDLSKEAFYKDLTWLLGSKDAASAKVAAIKVNALKGGVVSPDVTLPPVNAQEYEKAGKEAGEAFVSGAVNAIQDGNSRISEVVNEWTSLLNKDFSTAGKKDATAQLASASKEYADALARNGETSLAEWDEAGIRAGFTFINAYNEALGKGIAQSSLEKYGQDLFGYEQEDLEEELEGYKVIMQDYAKITSEIGNRPMTEEVLSSIREYVKYLDIARTRQAFGDQDVSNELELANQARERAISLAQAEADKLAATAAAAVEATTAEEQLAKAKGDTANTTTSQSEEETQAVVDQTNAVEKETEAVENLAKAKNELAVVSKQSTDAQTESTNAEAKAVGETASETTQQLANEAKALETVSDASKKAAKGKASVAKENIALAETANATTPAVTEESTALQKLEEEGALSELQDGGNNGAVAITNTTTAVSKLGKELDDSTKKALVLANIVKNRYGYDLNPDDLITNAVGNRSPENNVYRLGDYRSLSVTEAYDQNGRYDPTLRQTTSYKQLESETLRVIGARIKAESALRVEQAKGIKTDNSVVASLQQLINYYEQAEIALRSIAQAYDKEPTDFSYAIFDANIQQRSSEMYEKQAVTEAQRMSSVQDANNRRAIAAYKDLEKAAVEYYTLVEKSASGKNLSTEEIARLNELTAKWVAAKQAKNEYSYGGGSNATRQDADDAHNTFETKAQEAYINSILDRAKKVNAEINKAQKNTFGEYFNKGFNERIDAFQGFIQDIKDGNIVPGTGQIEANFEGYKKAVEEFTDASVVDFHKINSSWSKDLNEIGTKIQSTLNSSSGMRSGLKREFQELYREVMTFQSSGGATNGVIEQMNSRFAELEHQLNASGRAGKSFSSIVGQKVTSSMASLINRYLSIYAIMRYARQMVTTVKEIDTSLTELRKVSDASTLRLQQSLQKSVETAKELGSSVKDIIDATADWARLGYDVDAAEELARIATLYKNVGDNITVEDANKSLISTLKAYSFDPDEAESIVDKFNEVANNFAIESGGIGDALQRSAAAFNAANTDLSKSIALITAANEVVQNPEQVGTMWTTVSARIRGAKSELADMDEETDEYVESTSKLRNLVKSISGVDIMADDTTFKDIYTIVVEIAEVWDQINDINRASLLEALAGKRQANRLVAAIENVDTLKEAYQTAEESQGSAMREQANYAKSIQYSLDQFTARIQELTTVLLKSQTLKDGLDAINGLLDKITKFISSGPGKFIMGTVAALGGIKLLGIGSSLQMNSSGMMHVTRLTNPFSFLSSSIGANGKQLVSAATLGELYQYSAETNRLNPKGGTPTVFPGSGYYSKEAQQIIAANSGIIDPRLFTTQTFLQQTKESFKSIGANILASLAITGAIKTLSAFISVEERLGNAAARTAETFKKEQDQIYSYKDEVSDLKDTLESNTASIEEQVSARERLIEIQKEINELYSQEAANINVLTGEAEDLEAAFDALAKTNYDKMRRSFNASDGIFESIADWAANSAGGYKTNFDRMLAEVGNYRVNLLDIGENDYLKSLGVDSLILSGNLFDVYDELQRIQNMASERGASDNFLQGIQKAIDDTAKDVENYGDLYDQYVFNTMVLSNDALRESYYNLETAYERYTKAYTEGDKNTAEIYANSYAEYLNEAITSSNNQGEIIRFFEALHPQLTIDVKIRNLEEAIADPEVLDRVKKTINANLFSLGAGYEYVDDINDGNASEAVKALATEFGFSTVDAMIDAIVKSGALSDRLTSELNSAFDFSWGRFWGRDTIYDDTKDRIAALDEFTQAEKQAWINVTRDAKTGNEAWEKWEQYLLSLEDHTFKMTDAIKESIDNAQSTLDSLASWSEKLSAGSVTDNELIDLYQEFPSLLSETKTLDEAIDALANKTIQDLRETLGEDIPPALENALHRIEVSTKRINANLKKVSYASSLSTMAGDLEKLSTIYNDIQDGENFTYSNLFSDDFVSSFGALDEYDKFVETVMNSPDDIKAVQESFNRLTQEYLQNSDALEELSDANRDYTIKLLEQQGITNAAAVVDGVLAYRRNLEQVNALVEEMVGPQHALTDATKEYYIAQLQELGIKNAEERVNELLLEQQALERAGIYDLNTATAEQISLFMQELDAVGLVHSSYATAYLAKLNFANVNLNSRSTIEQLIAIANAAGASAEYVQMLKNALSALQGGSSPTSVFSTTDKNGKNKYYAVSDAELENALNGQGAVSRRVSASRVVRDYGNQSGKAVAQATAEVALAQMRRELAKNQLNAKDYIVTPTFAPPSSSSSASSGAGGSGADSADEFLEVMDWIEVKIARIERDIDNLDQTAEATWRKWTDRTKALTSEIAEVNKEIDIQQAGMLRYLQEAESVNLSAYYKERVRNGEIDIERITDEDLKQQIDDYTEWYIMMPPRTVMCAEKIYLIAGTPLEALCHNVKMKQAYA